MEKIFAWSGWTLAIALGEYLGRLMWSCWVSPKTDIWIIEFDKASGFMAICIENKGRSIQTELLVNLEGLKKENVIKSEDFAWGKTGRLTYRHQKTLLPFGPALIFEFKLDVTTELPRRIKATIFTESGKLERDLYLL